MQETYESISRIWSLFPKEFNNLSLYNDKVKLQNLFEEKKLYFEDYLTKILIIGDVSTGKSSIINSLLGKDYFGTLSGNGTVAFFYCCQTEKDYEYFTINDVVEVKDIEILKNTQGLDVPFKDYIDYNSTFKVYIKNVNKLLQNKTVIVDCPGFGHSDDCDKRIDHHCDNADIIIFIFHYDAPATLNQRNYIKKIRKQNRKPTCLFVYNKCDEIEFDEEKLKILKEKLIEIFHDLYHESNTLSIDPLYFVSAKNQDMGKDFKRLKTELLAHKNVNYIRYLNVQSILFNANNNFKEIIGAFISSQKREKIALQEKLNQITNSSNAQNRENSNLQDFVRNLIDKLSKDFQRDKIFNVIYESVRNHNGKCTKHDAYPFILNLANSIDKEIFVYLQNLLDNRVICRINNKIEDIKKENLNEINIVENIQFTIENHFSFMITDINLNIFWPHEKGDKTKKVKKAYKKFLQTVKITDKITENILKFYNEQLSKIKSNFDESIQLSKRKHSENFHQYHQDLKNKENLIESLERYENDVKEFIQSYNVSFY